MIDLALANSVSDNRALGNHLVGPKPSRLQGTIIENSIENSRVESDSASSLLSIARRATFFPDLAPAIGSIEESTFAQGGAGL
jgi:hypothetical protein